MQSRRVAILIVMLIIISVILGFLSLMTFFVHQSNLWANNNTQIDKLHELGFDGSGVTIGIIDTGVDSYHQEFESFTFIGWKDLINNDLKYYDDDDHGTHIIGILASLGSYQGLFSGINIKGISSGVKIIVTKSIPMNQYIFGGGNDSTISRGIKFCIENGADIILLSMGLNPEKVDFNEKSETIEQIYQAINKGIFVIIPAGNDGDDDDGDVIFPASIDNVISVGAINKGNSIMPFSSKGHQYPITKNPNKKPELVAPGDKIISTRVKGGYGELSGTSQASAYVAGIIALLLDAYPEFKHDGNKNKNVTTIQLFKDIFAKTAKKIGSLQGNDDEYSHDDLYGYGLIQAFETYKELAKY